VSSEKRLNEILSVMKTEAFAIGKGIVEEEVVISPEMWKQMQIDMYNNSQGNLNEFDGYNCDICHNKGFIARLDENGYEVHRYCKCQKVRSTLRRAKRSGLGDILSDFTFDKFKALEQWQIDLKNKAQAFCKDDSAKWFFIGGQVGCGKSHLCTAIAAHYIKAGLDVQYMVWVEDSKPLKALVNDIGYQEAVSKYKNVDVLYIDDFLKTQQGEQPTKGDINLAFELLNRRLLNPEQITIISSEKTMPDLLGYDEGTMSRIYKLCGPYKTDIAKDIKKNYRLRE
jgi:DNA replication protein DnaC